ncbi:ATP-binding cassette domain-containing protein [Pseudonocardia sp. GCM10023141]|uniref:ATP-binding cassette domain-containing protein n=1 Tax=Pseudonocardia sp. GCM10023141 TaxID=3252653 RepID=UPI00362469A7
MTHAAVPEAPEPEPVLRAESLGLRTRRGWVFRDLTLAVPAGGVAALCGAAGSGRSMALLALSGRATTSAGTLDVAGAVAPAVIRTRVAVARIGGAVELEPDLRMADHISERRLLGATGPIDGPADALGVTLRPGAVVGDLGGLDALLFAVALAAMDRAAVIVVDDVDLGLDDRDRDLAWQALHRLSEHGVAVVAAAAEAPRTGAVVRYLQGSESWAS